MQKTKTVIKGDNPRKRKAAAEPGPSSSKKRIQPTSVVRAAKSRRSSSDDEDEKMQVVPSMSPEEECPDEPTISTKPSTSNHSNHPSTSKAPSTNGPKLLIKEKHPVDKSRVVSEVFAQFLSMCLAKDRTNDMKKIVERLKRHYEQMDPQYAHSTAFIELLNEKRDSLVNGGNCYVHINDVDMEMKCRKKIPAVVEKKDDETIADETTSEIENPEKARKIRILSKAMEKCSKRIKDLGDAEVDWSDEDNSNYVKLARYEERMAQMYYKLCELTGDDKNAGRRHMRSKSLKVTQIEAVDQAIISFMTKKMKDKREKTQNGLPTAECFAFPDFCDIFKCIQTCNSERSLGMDKRSMEKLAEKAFRDLGNHLQSVRRADYMDSFALLDNDSDPALHDAELMRRLDESRDRGRRRLDTVFEDFVTMQETGNAVDDGNSTGSNAEDNDDDEDDEEEEEEETPTEGTDFDIDSISQQGSVASSVAETIPTDTVEIEQVTPKDSPSKEDVSDSAETVILAPREEDTATTPIASKKPGPKSSKIDSKPSITNIENVRVLIKAQDIVKINGESETQGVAKKSTSNLVKPTAVSEDKLKRTKSAPEDIGQSKNDSTDVDENLMIASSESNEKKDSGDETNGENLQVKRKSEANAEERQQCLENIRLVNQEITSSTEGNNIEIKSSVPEITLEEDVADTEDVGLIENDSPLPDSTLKVAGMDEPEDTKGA